MTADQHTDPVHASGSKPAQIPGLMVRSLNDMRVLERVKVLDKYVFPVSYSEKYYTTVATQALPQFNYVAYFHDMLVGSCVTRLEDVQDEPETYNIYILTIGVLEPYRRLGIATALMKALIAGIENETKLKIKQVRLHVQVGSTAIEFYKSLGFTIVEEVKDYYKLDVSDAFHLSKVVPQPHLASNASGSKKK